MLGTEEAITIEIESDFKNVSGRMKVTFINTLQK